MANKDLLLLLNFRLLITLGATVRTFFFFHCDMLSGPEAFFSFYKSSCMSSFGMVWFVWYVHYSTLAPCPYQRPEIRLDLEFKSSFTHPPYMRNHTKAHIGFVPGETGFLNSSTCASWPVKKLRNCLIPPKRETPARRDVR